MYTIAVHNGSAAHRSHNRRDYDTVSKEPHIRPGGEHEIWEDKNPREVYDKLFGDAIKDYNDNQKRSDRKITDYYAQICHDKKKHPVYECIVGVYSDKDSKPLEPDTCRHILLNYIYDWDCRNPNLVIVGAYYHNDEQGKQPHVHIDYVPVAHGYKRGMHTQTAIDRALQEQGYIKTGRVTPQMKWQAAERKALEVLCRNWAGLTISHPQEGKGVKHLETATYKAQQDLSAAQEQLSTIQQDLSITQEQLSITQAQLDNLPDPVEEREKLNKLRKDVENMNDRVNDLNVTTAAIRTLANEYGDITKTMGETWQAMIDSQARSCAKVPVINTTQVRRGMSKETLYTVSREDADTITSVFRKLTPEKMHEFNRLLQIMPNLTNDVRKVLQLGSDLQEYISQIQSWSELSDRINELEDFIRDKGMIQELNDWQEERELIHAMEDAFSQESVEPEIPEPQPESKRPEQVHKMNMFDLSR